MHWFPELGSVRVANITRAQVKAVLNEKSKTYARATVTLMSDVLRACLNAALEDRLITVNPVARLGKGAPKGRKAEPVEVFSAGVLAFILDTAKRTDPTLYPIVLLLARTGMRIGEALTLQAGNIDLGSRSIHVKRTWGSRRKADQEGRINTPKGGRYRLVDMSNQLTDVMKLHLAPYTDSRAWIFPGRDP